MTALTLLLPDVWRWTWFSEEKGMEFNGYAVRLPAGLVLIDPAYAEETLWAELESSAGRPTAVLLTNKDHERASDELRRRFGARVFIHEADAPLLAAKPDQTFDGKTSVLGLRPVRLEGLKSPGECAFLWPERKLLFVGDAVTGHPAGSFGLVKKHAGLPHVKPELRKLLALDFDGLLMGDGEPFLSKAKPALERFLAS